MAGKKRMAAHSVLVADIGGTHARFAMAQIDHDQVALADIRDFRTEEFNSLDAAAKAYLATIKPHPQTACFAVAAPVDQEEIQFTNSPWRFRREALQSSLSLKQIQIVNDFYAMAAGVACLPDEAFEVIKSGPGDPAAPVLVTGPGTGLGQALAIPTSAGLRIISTQGGHVGFAPMTDDEAELLKIMRRHYRRVSVERLLSGEGLVNIYQAVGAMAQTQEQSLRPDEITAAARDGSSVTAAKTVAMFFKILGRTVGDAVLSTGARGGVVLTGGILPKNRDLLLKSGFIDSFLDKGRMQSYVADVPVRLMINETAALLGAAHIASRMLPSGLDAPVQSPPANPL